MQPPQHRFESRVISLGETLGSCCHYYISVRRAVPLHPYLPAERGAPFVVGIVLRRGKTSQLSSDPLDDPLFILFTHFRIPQLPLRFLDANNAEACMHPLSRSVLACSSACIIHALLFLDSYPSCCAQSKSTESYADSLLFPSQECIKANPTEARQGVSRPTIKK